MTYHYQEESNSYCYFDDHRLTRYLMDLPRSTYLAGIAGVAIGLGGTLLYRRTSPGRGDETLVRLAAALEGLTAQLNVLQESLGRIEELVRERQQAAACDDNTDARQLVDGIQLRSRSVNSRYSAYSSGAQSDAFDTAEEDNVQRYMAYYTHGCMYATHYWTYFTS